MDKNKIEFYTKYDSATGFHVAYERCPIPGGNDMAVVSRDSETDAMSAAIRYVDSHGSCFKAERSVV
jgi:hypothetical protein